MLVERIEHGQVALAGHAEGEVDAMDLERVHEELATGAGLCSLGHASPVRWRLVVADRITHGKGRRAGHPGRIVTGFEYRTIDLCIVVS
jgi:hypothetical protein